MQQQNKTSGISKLSPRRVKELQDETTSLLNEAKCVQEKPTLYTLTLEADNVFIEFQKVDSYKISQIKLELIQFCASLRIIESIITITKEEE